VDEPWTLNVLAPPNAAADKVRAHTLEVRSVWFPSPRSLRAWGATPHHMWHRFDGDTLLLGPRIASIQAARFCPMLRGHATTVDGGTRWTFEPVTLPTTRVVMAIWTLVILAWAFYIGVQYGQGASETFGLFIFWLILAIGSAGGAWLGRVRGIMALREGLDELVAAVTLDDGDDW